MATAAVLFNTVGLFHEVVVSDTASLSGVGAASSNSLVEVQSDVSSFNGVGTASSGSLIEVQSDISSLSGNGTTSSDSLVLQVNSATITGVGGVSSNSLLLIGSDNSSLSGTGSTASDALVIIIDSATVSGSGSVSASGDVVDDGASLTGTGGISADGEVISAQRGGGGRYRPQYRQLPKWRWPYAPRATATVVISSKANLNGKGTCVGTSYVITCSDVGLVIGFTWVEATGINIVVGRAAVLDSLSIKMGAKSNLIKIGTGAVLAIKDFDMEEEDLKILGLS